MKIKKGLQQIGIFLSSSFFISLFFASPVLVRDASAGTETSLTVSSGFRVDNLDWNIADTDGSPNILSELTWSDLTIIQITAYGKIIIADKFYLRGLYSYGQIIDGENQDSDYLGNNRTFEYSRSNNSADDGNVMDASVGWGYQFKSKSSKITFTPLIGYSYHEQNLVMTNGYQTLSLSGWTGPFSGLNSKYDALWKGPWTGIDLSLEVSEKMTLSGVLEYHWVDYEGVADWNLRDDFQHPKSFEHFADGNGTLISAAIDYAFSRHWSINVITDYQDWSTDPGIDRTYFSDGTESDTLLNEVNWNSITAKVGATYSF